MAFGRFSADTGGGFRGNPADFGSTASLAQRASVGSEQNPAAAPGSGNMLSSAMPGNPHSSRGFRKALEKSQRGGNRLKDQLPGKTNFGGPGFKKPNYFSQGGGRHGMHIGAGAPFTGPAAGDAGSGFGGE